LERFYCLDGRQPYPPEAVELPTEEGALGPPACPRCGSPVRPGVVWFGEMLPEAEVAEAWEVAARCGVMLVVGTSGLVQPAAALPRVAKEAGATVVEINPEPSEVSALASVTCRGPAGVMLPALVARLRGDA
jgi:NAD-dependent deacetylase